MWSGRRMWRSARWCSTRSAAPTAGSRQWLDAAGVDARPAIELDNIEAIKNIVAAGLGMSIVPGAAIRERDHHLITRPLDPPLQATFALIQRRTRPDNTALKVVREAVLAGTAA